jgi:hypothetical protein
MDPSWIHLPLIQKVAELTQLNGLLQNHKHNIRWNSNTWLEVPPKKESPAMPLYDDICTKHVIVVGNGLILRRLVANPQLPAGIHVDLS